MKDPKSRRRIGKYPRVSVDLPLEYREMFHSRLYTGVVGNLSDKGLLFRCHHEMSVGTILRIRVMFSNGCTMASFEAIVKIVWKDFYVEGSCLEYKYGAEITYISEEDLEKLNQLLRDSLQLFFENQKEVLPRFALR